MSGWRASSNESFNQSHWQLCRPLAPFEQSLSFLLTAIDCCKILSGEWKLDWKERKAMLYFSAALVKWIDLDKSAKLFCPWRVLNSTAASNEEDFCLRMLGAPWAATTSKSLYRKKCRTLLSSLSNLSPLLTFKTKTLLSMSFSENNADMIKVKNLKHRKTDVHMKRE